MKMRPPPAVKLKLQATKDLLKVTQVIRLIANIQVTETIYKDTVANRKPHRSSKIVIIYPADQMNLNAANAFLKVLEEPTVPGNLATSHNLE